MKRSSSPLPGRGSTGIALGGAGSDRPTIPAGVDGCSWKAACWDEAGSTEPLEQLEQRVDAIPGTGAR